AAREGEVAEVEADGLRRARPARVEQLEQGPVAASRVRRDVARREQRFDLLERERARELARRASLSQARGGGHVDRAVLQKVLQERADARQAALDRSAREAALRQSGEPRA